MDIIFKKEGGCVRKRSKLRFTSEQQQNKKRFRAFIAAFCAFVLVLGTVSTLIFMKSLNFDIKNILKTPDDTSTTTEPTTAPTRQVSVVDSAVLLVCCDTEENLTLLAIVQTDAKEKAILVQALETDASTTAQNDVSFQTVFAKNGMAGLKNAVSSAYGLQFDRYIKMTESNLKKAISSTGDISLQIPNQVAYRGMNYSLFLDAGEQTLTGDLFVKYLRYADTDAKSTAAAALVQKTLQSLNGKNREQQFNTLFNLSDTDFSIMDLTDSNGLIEVYVALCDSVRVNAKATEQ